MVRMGVGVGLGLEARRAGRVSYWRLRGMGRGEGGWLGIGLDEGLEDFLYVKDEERRGEEMDITDRNGTIDLRVNR